MQSSMAIPQRRLDARLEQWLAEARRIEAELRHADEDEKLGLRARVRQFEQRVAAARARLRTLRSGGADERYAVVGGLVDSWQQLKMAARESLGAEERGTVSPLRSRPS